MSAQSVPALSPLRRVPPSQGRDLDGGFTIPVQGPFPPVSPALVHFSEKIKSAVETIVPSHGRVGTMEHLKAALAARTAQN